MTDDAGAGPVAAFCAQLKQLRRRSGRSPSGLAHDLKMSRGHLYAILNGEVKRPPDFSRVVEPFVRACGGDDEAVAYWRQRHDVLEQVYDELNRRRRRDETAVGARSEPPEQPAPPGPAPPGPASPAATPQVMLERGVPEQVAPGGLRFGTRRRRWPLVVTFAAAIVLVAFGASAVTAKLIQTPAAPAASVPVAPGCPGAPQIGTNLLDIPQPAGGREAWWPNNGRIDLRYDRHSFAAHVQHATEFWDLLIVHSCNPIVEGRHYRLSFTASADVPVSIVLRVQDNRAPKYQASLDVRVPLTAKPKRLVYDFVGAVTNPESEVAFLVGANPDFRLSVSDVELVTTAL